MRRGGVPNGALFFVVLVLCGLLLYMWPLPESMTPVWLGVLFLGDAYHHSAGQSNYAPKVSVALQERLQRLLQSPIPSYEDALKANEVPTACPRTLADRQAIADQLRMHSRWWTTVRVGELVQRRMAMVKYLEGISANGDLEGRPGGGRGIVMTGGNKDTTGRLLVTIRILRFEHNCKLPIEVFTFPNEIEDLWVLSQLNAMNVKVIELNRLKLRKWKNFQIKADAIIASSFEEVLYLDSDNIPVRDPTYLFDTELYSGPGQPKAVFWPDITKDHPTNPIWRLMGKQCDFSQWQLETGQIVISKTGNNGLNLAALHVAAHMQIEHPFYFKLSDGDKDTFRYGFWALGLPYSTSPYWLSTLGFHDDWETGRFCGIAMVQYDIVPPSSPSGEPSPLFVHANLLKHRERSNKAKEKGGSSQPFSIIKRAAHHDATEPTLSAAKLWVYGNQGPCLDLAVRQDLLADPSSKNISWAKISPLRNPELVNQHTVEERFAEVNGAAFKDFDRMYRAHGGRDGGWESA